MALYTPGGLVGQLSGKIGNLVASHNRYGSYFRTRVVPVKVDSDYTADVRGRLASLSQAWGALTDAQKESWRTWAATNPVTNRVGMSVYLQPSAAFIKINARILQIGGTQIDVPPVVAPPAGITGLSVTAAAAVPAVSIAWTSGALAADEFLMAWVAVIDSQGRKYYRNRLKLAYIGSGADTTPADALAEVVARFGTLIEDQTIFVEAEVWSDVTGLVSGRVYATCDVAA